MSLLCTLFGHSLSVPTFTDDGKWACKCLRCPIEAGGSIPPQHQHVYGPKFRRAGEWFWSCGCGHIEHAPAPVKRAKKESGNES